MARNPQYYDERIIFMSMFNDIEWTKKGNTEQVLHTAAFCDPIHARRQVLPGARVRKYVVECNFQRTSKDNETLSHCTWLTYSSVMLSTRYLQRQSHCRLDSWRREEAMSISKIL